VAHGHLVVKKKTRAGAINNPLRVEIARGSEFATRARARQQPMPAGVGLANPRFSLIITQLRTRTQIVPKLT
jgi:hypothetical protein